MIYSLTFTDVATGAAADTFKTIAAILTADTAGYRARLLSLDVGPADDAPADLDLAIRIATINVMTADGTATAVAAADIGKADPGQIDSLASGARNYTAEPTTYETEPFYETGLNGRGTLTKEWAPGEGPSIGQDSLLGLLAAPRSAVAIRLSGTLTFETY